MIDSTDRQADMTVRGEAQTYYLAHVDDDTDECILWPYAVASKGYGALQIDGAPRKVHVLACERHHGPRPPGMWALHAPVICHNPLCFNWRHLSWGTPENNSADRTLDGMQKDRSGEHNGQAKLTWAQVTEIRARYAAGGVSYATLGAEYGVGHICIGDIIRQRRWRVS